MYDEVKGAYYEIYAERLGLTAKQVRDGDFEPSVKDRFDEMRKEIPMNISIAEPSKATGN